MVKPDMTITVVEIEGTALYLGVFALKHALSIDTTPHSAICCTIGAQSADGSLVDIGHMRCFFNPIVLVILNNAQRVCPYVLKSKSLGDLDGSAEGE